MTTLAFLDIGFGEMMVVGFVALLLFGGRLPEVMRSLGSAYRNLRRGVEDLSRQAMQPDLKSPQSPPYRPTPPMPMPPTAAAPQTEAKPSLGAPPVRPTAVPPTQPPVAASEIDDAPLV